MSSNSLSGVTIKRHHFFKMVGIIAEYLKVRLNLFKRWHPKECKKKKLLLEERKTNVSLWLLFCITRQNLVIANSNLRDRFVSYPQTYDRFF